MARVRSIHPGAPMDEDVAFMSIHARYLWAYLPCHADREGRLKDAPFTIKTAVFPADDVDVDELLTELASRGHITRYSIDGRRLIQIRSFSKYQAPHIREAASTMPAPAQVSLRQTLAVSSTPIPDPGPDVSPERVPDPEPPAPIAKDPELWTAGIWLRKFTKQYLDRYGITYGGGLQTAKACGAMDIALKYMPHGERISAQERCPQMLKTYFADKSATNAKHPFHWFVDRFDSLRITGPPPRTVDRDQALEREMWK